MREERAARRVQTGSARIQVERSDPSGRLVFEARNVGKSFEGRAVIHDFSDRIMRGDRIGLIGPNGSGKTTLLRLLLGEIEPDGGSVRRGANVQVAYYDQQREQLDPEATVFDTIGEGNEIVTVNGRNLHVNGYLRDFLFPPERARAPVKSLSGGERNRLMLARLFTRPANVLVLDEPTNDLDLETLELLEEQLVEFAGTLLLVTHDRAFLDNVVTSTLVFEGEARVRQFVGGYADWLRQRAPAPAVNRERAEPRPVAGRPPGRRKLSYNEERELAQLPARIEALEAEQRELSAAVSDPEFYREPAESIRAKLARLEALPEEILQIYSRWHHLDSLTG